MEPGDHVGPLQSESTLEDQLLEAELREAQGGALEGAPTEIALTPNADPRQDTTPPASESLVPANEPEAAGSSRRRLGFTRRIFQGTFHYGLAQNLAQVVRFLLIPVYTRFLSVHDFGVTDLCAQFSSTLTIGMRAGVPGAVTRYYFDHHEGPALRDYVLTVTRFMVSVSLSVGAPLLLVGPWLFPAWNAEVLYLPFGVMVIVNAIVDANTEVHDRLVMAREQSAYRLRMNLMQATVQIACGLLLVVGFRWGAAGMLGSYGVANAIYLVQCVRYLRPELQGRFRGDMLWTSVAYGMSILPHHLIGSFAPLLSRSILSWFDSVEAVGVFALAYRFMAPPLVLLSAFQTAFSPIYFSVREERTEFGLKRLGATARNVWALAITCAVGAALLGPPLILVMTPSRYHVGAALLPILLLGFVGRSFSTVVGLELFYSKKFSLVPTITFISVCVMLLVTALTVVPLGPAGLAWADVARCWTEAILAGIISTRLVSIPHQWFSMARVAACGIAAVALAWGIPQNDWWEMVGCGLGGIAVFPILLWVTGDPSVRDGIGLARRRLFRSGSATA